MDLQWASNELLPFLSQLPCCHIPFSNNNNIADVFWCQLRICLFIWVVSACCIDLIPNPVSHPSPSLLSAYNQHRLKTSSTSPLLCSRAWITRPAIFPPGSLTRFCLLSAVSGFVCWCEHVQSVLPSSGEPVPDNSAPSLSPAAVKWL